MHDFRLHYEQEVFVFWIVDSGLEVVARKFADGVVGIPEGDEQKFCPLALDTAQNLHAATAFNRAVLFQARCLQIYEICICLCGRRNAAPDSCDHCSSCPSASDGPVFSIA